MKKILVISSIVLWFLFLPFLGYLMLGTMVNHEYNVDQARIFLTIDSNKMTKAEIESENLEITALEKEIHLIQFVIVLCALGTVLFPIVLLRKGKV